MIYKTIDLCAGIGGIRRGFEMTGKFKNVLAAEIDPSAASTYMNLFGEDPSNDLTSEKFKKEVVNTDYDVLLAGFPCQSFSSVGKKLGFRDTTRGTIFFDIADIISRTNPRAVFLENVENLMYHDHGNTIEIIIKTLEDELGYRVIGVSLNEDGNYVYNKSSFVRNSKDFGVPQNRPRVYIMAFSKKIYGDAIKLLNQQLPDRGDKVIFSDVNEILDPIADDRYYLSEGYLETLKNHKIHQKSKGYGFGYCIVNQSNEEHPIANTILATGGSGKERNLIYQPKEGIAGEYLPRKKTPLNREGIRTMTPNEWGRLQGFIGYAFMDENGEDQFEFPEGMSDLQKYKQLGNSVTIPVIEKMANFMAECFEVLEKQQADIVKAVAENNAFFTKRDIMKLLDLSSYQAWILLKDMVEKKSITRISRGKGTRYTKYQSGKTELPPYSPEEKIIKFASEQNIITNQDVQVSLGVSQAYANVLLSGMAGKGILIRRSRGHYSLNIKNVS